MKRQRINFETEMNEQFITRVEVIFESTEQGPRIQLPTSDNGAVNPAAIEQWQDDLEVVNGEADRPREEGSNADGENIVTAAHNLSDVLRMCPKLRAEFEDETKRKLDECRRAAQENFNQEVAILKSKHEESNEQFENEIALVMSMHKDAVEETKKEVALLKSAVNKGKDRVEDSCQATLEAQTAIEGLTRVADNPTNSSQTVDDNARNHASSPVNANWDNVFRRAAKKSKISEETATGSNNTEKHKDSSAPPQPLQTDADEDSLMIPETRRPTGSPTCVDSQKSESAPTIQDSSKQRTTLAPRGPRALTSRPASQGRLLRNNERSRGRTRRDQSVYRERGRDLPYHNYHSDDSRRSRKRRTRDVSPNERRR